MGENLNDLSMFIILTEIRRITGSRIWNFFQFRNTNGDMLRSAGLVAAEKGSVLQTRQMQKRSSGSRRCEKADLC